MIVATIAMPLMAAGVGMARGRDYLVSVKPVSPQKGFEKLNVSKAAIGSTQIILWQNAAINPDCTAMRGVLLSVARQPEHGKVTVSDDGVYAGFPPANPRHVCNSQKAPGHQAHAGYTGHDKLVLQGSSPESRVREINLDILVR